MGVLRFFNRMIRKMTGDFGGVQLAVILSLIQAAATEILKCKLPTNFSLHTHPNGIANVYNAHLEITLDYKNVEFYGYGDNKFIAIRGRQVTVNFHGSYMDNYLPAEISSQPRVFKETFDEEITGNAQRILLSNAMYLVFNCRLILLPVNEEKSSTPMIVRNDVRRIAESCLESHMCERFRNINQSTFIESSNSGKFCFPPGIPSSLPNLIARAPSELEADLGAFQDIVNKVVDVTLADVISNFFPKNGMINLPDINQSFSTGDGIFKPAGNFVANGGTFGNLTKLHRNKNVEITRIGNIYRIFCSVGLPGAQLHFPQYSVKYGIIRVSGQIDGKTGAIALEAAASTDYSQNPCIQKIEKIKVSKFENIDVSLTGFSLLNPIIGTIVDIVAKAAKESIIQFMEGALMSIANEFIKSFNCEKYRP